MLPCEKNGGAVFSEDKSEVAEADMCLLHGLVMRKVGISIDLDRGVSCQVGSFCYGWMRLHMNKKDCSDSVVEGRGPLSNL